MQFAFPVRAIGLSVHPRRRNHRSLVIEMHSASLTLPNPSSPRALGPRLGYYLLALSVVAAGCSDAPTSSVGPDMPEAVSVSQPSSKTEPSILVGASLYVDPASPAKRQADAWRSSRPADAARLDKIADRPQGVWLGDWMGADPTTEVANMTARIASTGAVPLFVLYNIPLRDCGLYSKGGASSPDAYRSWVSQVIRGIGNNKAVVVVEPDAVAAMDCLSGADQTVRLKLIQDAIRALKSAAGRISVYLDAGNSDWHPAAKMAPRLQQAGSDMTDGFSLNVSNFHTTGDNIQYGAELSRLLGGKHFVIDTSRNGRGGSTPYEWCNAPGRALGMAPTTNTGHALVDAFLWIKPPGESDGECNGGPSAGKFWSEYALGLVDRSTM